MIDKNLWHICKICGQDIKSIAKEYGGNGIYYSQAFLEHLNLDHQCNITDYFVKNCNIIQPECQCGQCHKLSYIRICGANFDWRHYLCGRNPGQQKWSIEAKITRKGINNPMYGKRAWNDGLTKNTSEIIQCIANKMTGRHISQDTKIKQSISAKKRIIHGHTGHKHTPEMKEFFKQHTLQMIKNGAFKQTQTKPHKIFKLILQELNITFEEEKIIHHWSFDFYIPSNNLYIEVDGDYFHSNPKIYPNGPQTKTQKINYARDMSKNNFCAKNNIQLLRFWESDILNNSKDIKEKLLCKLNK